MASPVRLRDSNLFAVIVLPEKTAQLALSSACESGSGHSWPASCVVDSICVTVPKSSVSGTPATAFAALAGSATCGRPPRRVLGTLSSPCAFPVLEAPVRHRESGSRAIALLWCYGHLCKAVRRAAFCSAAETRDVFVPFPRAERARRFSQSFAERPGKRASIGPQDRRDGIRGCPSNAS